MVIAIKLADKYIGSPLCSFLAIFSKKQQTGSLKDVNKILAVQLWGIGETILTLPAIEALRKKYPKAQIDVLATSRNKDVYYGNKSVSSAIKISLNPISIFNFIIKNIKKYDLVVDMEEYLNISAIISFFVGKTAVGYSHNSRAKLYTNRVRYNDKQHAAQTFLDLARAVSCERVRDACENDEQARVQLNEAHSHVTDINFDAGKLPYLSFSKKDKNAVDRFLKNNGIKKNDFVVCVAPGAAESAKARMWPYERYAELCDEIIERHKAIIIFAGSFNEAELIDSIQKKMENKAINAGGKLSLNQLFYFVSRCNLFIGNDAGPMHVAAAQGVKTLGLFGPNLPVRFGPCGNGNIGLYKGSNCEFSPCINVHKGEVPDCLYPRNSNDYQKCMKNISVNDVLKEVEKMV